MGVISDLALCWSKNKALSKVGKKVKVKLSLYKSRQALRAPGG
jgi:hypothetical protein